MIDTQSRRLMDQVWRNRIMDALSWLAEGAPAVRQMGGGSFFECFYDRVDDENPAWPWPATAPETMTPQEVEAVTQVLTILNAVPAELVSADERLIASGWLERIAPLARTALALMLERGCFDDEREESEPSNRALEATLREALPSA